MEQTTQPENVTAHYNTQNREKDNIMLDIAEPRNNNNVKSQEDIEGTATI